MSKISFGIRELDQYFKEALHPGITILIAGYPGAGKTTFAATIGYRNCLKGEKVLYLSFFEHADRFKSQMRSLGLDFEEHEKNGLFKYVKVPLIPSQEAVDSFVRRLMELATSFQPRIIVIDGITPLVQVMRDESKIRSFLQTVVYDVPRIIQGMLILVADLPFGAEEVKLAGIEFTVDAVFIMKYRVITSRIIRFLEIRKIRGAPLNIAEVPYQIAKKKGIKLFFPTLLHELKPPKFNEELYFGIPILDKSIAPLYKGIVILVTFPPQARTILYTISPFIKLVIQNRLKSLIISYKYSDQELSTILDRVLKAIGYPINEFKKLILGFYSFNPTAMSFQEVFFREDEIIEKLKPDMIAVHGLDIIFKIVEFSGTGLDRLFVSLHNRLLVHRSNGKIIIYFIPKLGKRLTDTLASLADMVIDISYTIRRNMLKPRIIVWKKMHEPVIIDPDVLLKQITSSLTQSE